MVKASYDPDWIPPPGATVEDLLSRREAPNPRVIMDHLGQREAEMLFEGELPIDSEIAAFLAESVGLTRSFWIERERLYRAALVRRQFEKQLLGELPLEEMRTRSFIQPLHSHEETMAEVAQFFGKDDSEGCREYIEQIPASVKQKTSRAINSRPASLAVWIRAGEINAERMDCTPWSSRRLEELLPEFRKLTRIEDPRKYLPELKRLCQTCGIALVVLRATNGCSARGAVKFVSPTKAMLLLSYRHLSDDQFWFSFFHELAHLLLHPQEDIIIDDWDESTTNKEIEADHFAADLLIPAEFQRELQSLRSDRSIISFARRVGVSRGIVVGQMQYRGVIGFNSFNHLRIFYQWDSNNHIEKKPK